MLSRHTERNAAACVQLLERASAVCQTLPALSQPLTPAQLEQRARIVRAVLNTRSLLCKLRQRADRLAADLERFKQRRGRIA